MTAITASSIESRLETLEKFVTEIRSVLNQLRSDLDQIINDHKIIKSSTVLPSIYCTPRPEGYTVSDQPLNHGFSTGWGSGGFGTINSIGGEPEPKPSSFNFEG